MSTTKTVKNARSTGEVAKTAIQVVERMMNLLDALAEQEESSSLKNLAAQTSLHPSTAHRILNDILLRLPDHFLR